MKRTSLGLLATILFSACVSTHVPTGRPETTLDAIAASLVHSAAQRTDIHGVRACLHAFREDDPTASGSLTTDVDHRRDLVGAEREREFLFALSSRMHVMESEFAAPESPGLGPAGIDATAEAFRTSHLLIGDYYVQGNQLVLSVRLIDVHTHVILAAARGTLPINILSDRALERLILPSQRLYRRETVQSRPAPQAPIVAQPSSEPRSYAQWRKRPPFEDTRIHRPWRTGALSQVLRVPSSPKCD